MNDFKYQKKTNQSDDDLMAHKDFSKVLQKHEAISNSYKLVKKWAIISSAGIAILTGVILFGSNRNEEPKENSITNQAANNQENQTIQPSFIASEEMVQSTPVEEIVNTSIIPTEKKTEIKAVVEIEESNNKEPIVEVEKTATTLTESKSEVFEPEVWYNVNELPEQEKIKLPTLYVSKLAWPDHLTKTELVKFPNINAVYKSVAREIPIVDGMAYITANDSKIKEQGIRLKGNSFPPALIRAIHKSDENSILLLKDIKLFLPGKGYINIGDKKIDIMLDKNYKKKLEQTQVIE